MHVYIQSLLIDRDPGEKNRFDRILQIQYRQPVDSVRNKQKGIMTRYPIAMGEHIHMSCHSGSGLADPAAVEYP